MRATPITSPFFAVPSRTSARVAGFMRMLPRATATRWVIALPATSTMCAAPPASKWLRAGAGAFSGAGEEDEVMVRLRSRLS